MLTPGSQGLPAGANPRLRERSSLLAAAIAAMAAVAATATWGGLGLQSLPGMALAALAAVAALWLVVTRASWLPVLLAPALIPFPLVGLVFPFELMLGLAGALLLLHLIRTNPSRVTAWTRWEVMNALFVLWALVTIYWCFDRLHVLLGVRRLLVGVFAGWTAYRLAGQVPRRVFETSLLLGLLCIGVAALRQSASSGLSAQGLLMHRTAAGDLGWGTANYVATLLLLLSPPAVAMLVSARPAWMRALALAGLVTAATLQVQVASRAAAVLFFFGMLVQVFLMLRSRARWIGVTTIIVAIALAVISPYGQGLLSRFTNLRDLGSMVVRLWYFREGWQRVVDFFPFGMGLNQGIPYPDKMSGKDLHNYWLVVTSELGLPGLLLWIATLVTQWRAFVRLRRSPGNAQIALALQVSFWLGQLHTLVEPTFQGGQYQFLWFWIGLGFLGYARTTGAGVPASAVASSER
ncbi:MAG: O-antigen ligase family protein [Candidatus Eisenbacteria bacterium]|nr:O-antigen ligase family protein [Candidatus Eisenbacteria bacterium]